jgi:osmotically-inducible protein OsmY
MRALCLLLGLALFTSAVFAQTAALPQNRQKLGGTDPTARIAREVMHEMLMLPYYSVFDNLAFRVEGNTVYLYGQVVSLGLKPDAEASVKHIEGVEKVVNNIEVLPPSPNDDRIRRAAYRAIYGNSVLSQYQLRAVPPIHIVVNRGHITLEGVVARQMDKQVAGMQANSVHGAFSVTNNLRVEEADKKDDKKK